MKVAGPAPTDGWGLTNSNIIFLDILLGIINLCLLLVLLSIFLSRYSLEKSKFKSISLVFIFLLLIQNILMLYFPLILSNFQESGMVMPFFILNLTETLALIYIISYSKLR